MNPTSIHEDPSIPGLGQWVKDPALLRLLCRPGAEAPIQPLAWEFPYATSVALKKKKKKKKQAMDWTGRKFFTSHICQRTFM